MNSNQEDNLLCKICKRLPTDLVEAVCCSSVFCWECVANNDFEAPCPACGAALKADDCIPNIPLKRIVDNMRTNCKFSAEGCQELITPPNRNFHESQACPFRRIECPNSPHCGTFKAQELLFHSSRTCSYREIPCPQECGQTVRALDIEEHLDNICSNTLFNCPNKCETNMKKDLIENHLISDCPLQPIQCQYFNHGCDQLILRSNLKEHLDYGMLNHLEMLSNTVEKQQKELTQVKEAIRNLENQGFGFNIEIISSCKQLWNERKGDILARVQDVQQKAESISHSTLWMILALCMLIFLVPKLKILILAVSALYVYQRWKRTRIPKWLLVLVTAWFFCHSIM